MNNSYKTRTDLALLRDGTYLTNLDDDGILDLTPHGASFGYYVGLGPWRDHAALKNDRRMQGGPRPSQDRLLGIWTDPSDGHVDVDEVAWVQTFAGASSLAKMAGQKAIWAIKPGFCIWLLFGPEEGEMLASLTGEDGLYLPVVDLEEVVCFNQADAP